MHDLRSFVFNILSFSLLFVPPTPPHVGLCCLLGVCYSIFAIMTGFCILFSWQVNLVEWLKVMVGTRRAEEVVDPNLEVKPSTRALKRALLVALRCVDADADKRPRMTQVVRMLEADEYPFREVPIFLFS